MSASRTLPRPFGPYVLTRALSADPLGETYRAGGGTGAGMRPFLLLRVFNGTCIDRTALLLSMETAVDVLDEIRGPAVARGAVLGAVEDVPFAAVEYVQGRPLDQLFAARPLGAVLPIEHALLITEKVLLALESFHPMEGLTGAPHGFLVPGFVVVSNDGETRLFGAGLGAGLLAALRAPRARQAFAPYVAPEVLESGKPSSAGDVYAAAAILYEALTGRPPVPVTPLESLETATLAIDGTPVPDDVKKILRRGLQPDVARRERSILGYRKELGNLLYGGPYSPSTFNLAFFMQRHFEKAIQREKAEIAVEEQIDRGAVRAAPDSAVLKEPPTVLPAPPPRPRPEIDSSGPRRSVEESGRSAGGRAPVPRPAEAVGVGKTGPVRTLAEPPKKGGMSGFPMWTVALLALALLGGGGYWAFQRSRGPRAAEPAPTPSFHWTRPTPLPISTPTPVVVGKDDPLFQAALQTKLQEEMKKRDQRIAREEQLAARKRQADVGRTAEETRKTKDSDDAIRAARDRGDREEASRLAREAQDARQREEVLTAARAVETAKVTVKEGDLLDVSLVDTPPKALTMPPPEATGMAKQRHVSGTVLLRVLVSETGRPEKIEILRDTTPRVGLAEACQSAIRRWSFSPAIKDGVKVKTWIAVQVPFKGL